MSRIATAEAQELEPAGVSLDKWRCPRCGRFLAKGILAPGSILEIKCHCNRLNILEATRQDSIIHRIRS